MRNAMHVPPATAIEPAAGAAADEHRQAFRDAMARLGAAVSIVTTDGPGGLAGFAATAVCSLSDSPPRLLVCLNRGSSAHPAVRANGVVCVNVLDGRHRQLSQLFGGRTPVAERFAAGRWAPFRTGAPTLDDALVSFDCEIANIHDGGTHDILVCEVIAIRKSDQGGALIYFDRDYHQLGA